MTSPSSSGVSTVVEGRVPIVQRRVPVVERRVPIGPRGGSPSSSGVSPSSSGVSNGSSGTIWQPPVNAEFQWYLNGEMDFNNSTKMGTGVTAYNGGTPPATDPTIYDVDGIENSATDVAEFHSLGDHVVCYIEIGAAGNYYSASEEGIPTTYYAQLQASGDLGNSLAGYPEQFININAPSAVSIIESMIQQQCAAKGFDAVETDLDETGGGNEGSAGFSISVTQNETYDETIATYIHSLGMAWFSKDTSDMDSTSFVDALEPYAQATIDEQASEYGSIGLDSVYVQSGKPVFDAEYVGGESTANFCPYDIANNINGTLFDTDLDGPRTPCR